MRFYPGELVTQPPQQEDQQPPEWEWDEQQRRHFRRVGRGMIEYAPTITIDGAEIENIGDNLQRAHEAMKQSRKALEEAERQREQQRKTGRLCPFVQAPSICSDCKADCALYRPTGCAMKRTTAAHDTQNMPCPFMRKCAPECALYDQGCTL